MTNILDFDHAKNAGVRLTREGAAQAAPHSSRQEADVELVLEATLGRAHDLLERLRDGHDQVESSSRPFNVS